MERKRVCIIGAGPSGNAALCWFANKKRKGQVIPEVVCYEKQSERGGMWNATWRTGTDQHGEPVHGGMYRCLWTNAPKECYEFPYYSFDEHFGVPVPSFLPRAAMRDYFEARWNKEDIQQYVRYSTVVKHVEFVEKLDKFLVNVRDLEASKDYERELFDYVFVATSHFSVPNVPEFPGMETFSGRILHSHDFRNGSEFAGQNVLIIGSHYSGDDVSIHCIKFGAKSAVISYRTKPTGCSLPHQISEKPLVERFSGNSAYFKDGSSAEFDSVILCTGYLHSYPFLSDDLKLKSPNCLYPGNLYNGIVWLNGGNNRLLYLGAQDLVYSTTMFDVFGLWAVKLVLGEVHLEDQQKMERDANQWAAEEQTLSSIEAICEFQTRHVEKVGRECGEDYTYNLDCCLAFIEWMENKTRQLKTFRDQCHTSIVTGTRSVPPKIPYFQNMDDSLETFKKMYNCK